MTQELEYYKRIANNAISRDKEKNDVRAEIDNIKNCKYSLPDKVAKLPGMRTIIATDPHDALRAATRTFSTVMPKFELTPLSPNLADLDGVESIEQNLKWHFWKMNRRGIDTPLFDIVKYALDYMAICFYVEYLPYSFEGRTDPRSKYLLKSGSFVWHVYNPQNVHPTYDRYGLQSVVCINQVSVASLIAEFGEDNEAIKKIKADLDVPGVIADIYSLVGTLYDYQDWTDRVRWFVLEGVNTSTQPIEEIKSGSFASLSMEYELERKEHGLGFLPWVYIEGDEPLLKSVVKTKAWEDLNILLSVRNWLVVRTAAHPAYATKTTTGEPIEVNFDSGTAVLPLKTSQSIDNINPRELDPHLTQIIEERQGAIHTTTVAKALQTLEFSDDASYALVNAILTAAAASLGMQKRISEIAIEAGIYIQMHWINYSQIGLMGRRKVTKNEDNPMLRAGADLYLPAGFMEPEDIQLTVELRADTPTDRQQRIAMANEIHKMGIPLTYCYEEAGIENGEVLHQQWQAEQIEEAQIQKEIRITVGEADIELQQKMMETQQANQPQPAAGGENTLPGPGAGGENAALPQGPNPNVPAEGGTLPPQAMPAKENGPQGRSWLNQPPAGGV